VYTTTAATTAAAATTIVAVAVAFLVFATLKNAFCISCAAFSSPF
jgi:hypothetical protein